MLVEQLDEALEGFFQRIAEFAVELHRLELAGHGLEREILGGLAILRRAGDVIIVDGAGGGEALVLLAGPAVVEDRLGEPGVGVFLQNTGKETQHRVSRRGGRLGTVGLERFHHRRGVVDGEAGGCDQDRERRKARDALQLVLGFLRARRPVERNALVFEECAHLGRIGRGLGPEQAIGHKRLRKARGNYAGRRRGTTAVYGAKRIILP